MTNLTEYHNRDGLSGSKVVRQLRKEEVLRLKEVTPIQATATEKKVLEEQAATRQRTLLKRSTRT